MFYFKDFEKLNIVVRYLRVFPLLIQKVNRVKDFWFFHHAVYPWFDRVSGDYCIAGRFKSMLEVG